VEVRLPLGPARADHSGSIRRREVYRTQGPHDIDILADVGPGLGRPLVNTIHGSSIANLKELRPGTIRILFAFDPWRDSILLVAGDKSGRWTQWCREAVPLAEQTLRALPQGLTRRGRTPAMTNHVAWRDIRAEGVTKSRISQIERGKIPGQDVLARYAIALGGRLHQAIYFDDGDITAIA
jgi:hypothetical protein